MANESTTTSEPTYLQAQWLLKLKQQFDLPATANEDGTVTIHDKDFLTGEAKNFTFDPAA